MLQLLTLLALLFAGLAIFVEHFRALFVLIECAMLMGILTIMIDNYLGE